MAKSLRKIYLDYAASTPVDLSVQKTILPYFASIYGNPESIHLFGQEAVKAVDLARKHVARTIGANFHEIVFTSSATESNNLTIRGVIKAAKFNIVSPRLLVSTIEHDSVLETARDLERDGIDVVYLPVDKSGIVDLDVLKKSLNKNTVLVSVIYVNNVTGAIQPIQKIANIIHNFRKTQKNKKLLGIRYPLFHTDAVQAFQYHDCNVNRLGVDLMTLSAHKLYGPKGVGVLYCKKPNTNAFSLKPIITGGGQEFGLRSSTHNVPAIVGCTEAFRKAYRLRDAVNKKIKNLRLYFINKLEKISPECEIHEAQHQSPGIISVYIPEFPKNAVTKLSDFGVAVSAGSACSSHSPLPSRVLRAMGVPEEKASGSIRISLGKNTTRKEIDETLKIMKTIMEKPI